jgi:antigen flippase
MIDSARNRRMPERGAGNTPAAAPPGGAAPVSRTALQPPAAKPSYGQILKSSALIGGASMVNVGIGIVRTKAMALLLGPSGVGLLGLYGAVADLAQSIAGMGIISSGVRQIAEASGSGEAERIARTAVVLRRTSILLGIVGAVLLAALAARVSVLTFGSDRHADAIALLSVAVFCRVISDGQSALLQGLRRIADLARMGMLGALFGTLISVSLVYWLGERGIVPSLVGIAAMTILTSWWYSRKVPIRTPALTALHMRRETAALLKLGFAFMASGLMMMGAAYAIRIMVLRGVGVEAAGLYQSAWTLGGMYVGLVLQAMSADFYPRLTAVAGDDAACNRLVNEQAHVSLLLGGPGVLATLALAPLVISLFYTARFHAAEEVLRWLCLGMTLRIVSWPMGFIILAKGEQGFFFWSELAWTAVYLGLALIGVEAFGLNGAGIAFFASYAFHCLMVYWIVRRLSGFRWSAANRRTGLVYLPLIGVVFCGFYALPPWPASAVGVAAIALGGVYSLQVLLDLVSSERIPRRVRQWLGRLRPAGAASDRPLRMEWLTAAFMVCAVAYMWTHWYEETYGWPSGLSHFVKLLASDMGYQE